MYSFFFVEIAGDLVTWPAGDGRSTQLIGSVGTAPPPLPLSLLSPLRQLFSWHTSQQVDTLPDLQLWAGQRIAVLPN